MDSANRKILESIANQILEGKLNAESACKLLNTVAKFEERTESIDLNNQH